MTWHEEWTRKMNEYSNQHRIAEYLPIHLAIKDTNIKRWMNYRLAYNLLNTCLYTWWLKANKHERRIYTRLEYDLLNTCLLTWWLKANKSERWMNTRPKVEWSKNTLRLDVKKRLEWTSPAYIKSYKRWETKKYAARWCQFL